MLFLQAEPVQKISTAGETFTLHFPHQNGQNVPLKSEETKATLNTRVRAHSAFQGGGRSKHHPHPPTLKGTSCRKSQVHEQSRCLQSFQHEGRAEVLTVKLNSEIKAAWTEALRCTTSQSERDGGAAATPDRVSRQNERSSDRNASVWNK